VADKKKKKQSIFGAIAQFARAQSNIMRLKPQIASRQREVASIRKFKKGKRISKGESTRLLGKFK
jgi:hypothetical protein